MRMGTVRLLRRLRGVTGPGRARSAGRPGPAGAGREPDGTPIDLVEDCADAVTADILDANGGVAWDERVSVGWSRLSGPVSSPGVADAMRDVRAVLDADRELDQYLGADAGDPSRQQRPMTSVASG